MNASSYHKPAGNTAQHRPRAAAVRHCLHAGLVLLVSTGLLFSGAAQAQLAISQVPLFLAKSIAPNVVLTLDDSGSMELAYVPSALYSNLQEQDIGYCPSTGELTYDIGSMSCSGKYEVAHPWAASNYGNALYYAPNADYVLPVDANGDPLSTSFEDAYINGFNPGLGSVDLSTDYRAVRKYGHDTDWDSQEFWGSGVKKVRAYYFTYEPTQSGCGANDLNDLDCYAYHEVSPSREQEFAIWYSFYRTRNLTTVSAASLGMADFGQDVRVAWQALNTDARNDCGGLTDTENCVGWDGKTVDNTLAQFKGQHRDDFYDWVFHLPTPGNTPLRSALARAGKLFTTARPYYKNPDNPKTNPVTYACRQNYSILMTDGLWNGDTPSGYKRYTDNTHTLPDDETYNPMPPYEGGHADSDTTLADIAFYYWANDLRTGLDNKLSKYMPIEHAVTITDGNGNSATLSKYWNPKNDPATWQHVVTYTVGLGLNAFLSDSNPPDYEGNTYTGDYPGLVTGDIAWPGPDGNEGDNISDLWHAALVSRGQFFGADNPTALTHAFKAIVNRIQERTSSSSNVAANSGRINTNTRIYQARYNSGDWSGKLRAFKFTGSGLAQTWTSSIPDASLRNIYTYNPGTDKKSSFQWSDLTSAQKTALNTDANGNGDSYGKERLKYLRGNSSYEGAAPGDPGPSFRSRTGGVLGDIVHSSPVFVGTPPNLPLGHGYNAFNPTRNKLIYVGANDGMLHAFNATTGKEVFAYVPDALYGKLSELTSPDYSHKFYVDGQQTIHPAKFNGSGSWHTVLIGTLGAGGRGVYALDITDGKLDEADDVLWEFTSADPQGNDLGYTIGQASVVRIEGQWYTVFGNGYNSQSGDAALYILNLDDGSVAAKINLGGGPNNGLATPAVVDVNGDLDADYIYAGTLNGVMWKFDVRNGLPTSGTKLFVAEVSGNRQPITSKPAVGRNPREGGIYIYFGTGRYFVKQDGNSSEQQTFYAIQDKLDGSYTAPTRSDLLEQEVQFDTVTTNTPSGIEESKLEVTTDKEITSADRGWFLDLPKSGERVTSKPILRIGQRLIFTSNVPTASACGGGGVSRLYELNAISGSRLPFNPFDVNDDGHFNKLDKVTITDASGNEKKVHANVLGMPKLGLSGVPTILSKGDGSEVKVLSGSSGNLKTVQENTGTQPRITWHKIQ